MSTLETITRLTCELVSRPSITPLDAGCQQLLGEHLKNLGFNIEAIRHGDVDNLWAIRDRGGPLLMFAGHTDVVPTGERSAWRHAPFSPTIENGVLYGRGAADMKGSLAAMLVSVDQFVKAHPERGSIAFLITSDEEGPALNGTAKIVETLSKRQVHCDYCVIGEPSSTSQVGDVIRIGRRGSLNGRLTINGIQGHVAYPQLALNPVHAALPMLSRITSQRWDEGNEDFPPTSFQISNVTAGTGASNVIPGQMIVDFNLRFSTAQTSDGLQARIEALCAEDQVDHQIEWTVSGQPFLTPLGRLLECVDRSIHSVQGFVPEHSTGGGTSDGRFIASLGCELVELGPVNDTIHQVNECVKLTDLVKLSDIYLHLMNRLLVSDA